MAAAYRELLDKLRLAFPKPISDKVHDSYFVHSILRALDRVDDLKSEIPLLGEVGEPDYEAARQARLRAGVSSIEAVTEELVRHLEGMTLYGHPCAQENVITQPTIASLIGVLLASLYNPNLCWDEHSRRVAAAEVEVSSTVAALVGYDPDRAAGLFTFGGTGATLYGVKLGLEKACPNTLTEGIREPAYVFGSAAAHYCKYNILGWLGLGSNRFIDIPCDEVSAIDVDELEGRMREVLLQRGKIAAIIATLGTTDAFGLDDLEKIAAMRDRLVDEFHLSYRPHIHADAVIGWAWSVFNDYPIDANPLGFRRRTVRAIAGAERRIRHLHLADSIGIDYHKTGFAPYVASQILVKDRRDFDLVSRAPAQMPYLYHFGAYRPGMFTLETTRSGTGVLAALANLRLFGREGWQVLLGHLVEMAQLLREQLEGFTTTTVLNRDNVGTVTVFRVYPPDVDTFTIKQLEFGDVSFRDSLQRHNDYNRRIFEHMRREALAGHGVLLSLTDCYRTTSYGEPIVGLKSFILSPFVDEEHVQAVVEKVREAQSKVPIKP